MTVWETLHYYALFLGWVVDGNEREPRIEYIVDDPQL
jgi:hypothetical protein